MDSLEKAIKYSSGSTGKRVSIINDYLLVPMLSELVNQTGLLHKTYVYRDYDKEPCLIALYRKRPSTGGFWNFLARAFEENQEVLRITFTGQLWCCNYYVPFYFMTAQSLRDKYNELLRDSFGADFVIVG